MVDFRKRNVRASDQEVIIGNDRTWIELDMASEMQKRACLTGNLLLFALAGQFPYSSAESVCDRLQSISCDGMPYCAARIKIRYSRGGAVRGSLVEH